MKPTPSSPVVLGDEQGDHQHDASVNKQNGNASYPHVPTLVLTGDLDVNVPLEATSKVAALFPNSTSVTIPEAGHEASFWSQCAQELASRFIRTLQVGDASCASEPEVVFPALGRFPLVVSQARAADVDPNGIATGRPPSAEVFNEHDVGRKLKIKRNAGAAGHRQRIQRINDHE